MSARRVSQRFLEDLREGLEASVKYFGPQRKTEREIQTCFDFVRNLGIRAREGTFIPGDDPPDVIYRRARFEVKEMLDQGRRRHQEYRDRLERARTATDPSDLLEWYTPIDITPREIGALIEGEVAKLAKRYDPRLKQTLDLLFYVNLAQHHLATGAMPNSAQFANCGWRSISALIGWGALVFFATKEAPKFIRDRVGFVTVRQFR